MLPNGYACLVAFLAVTWTRAVAAPLNGAATLDEYLFYLDDIATNVRPVRSPDPLTLTLLTLPTPALTSVSAQCPPPDPSAPSLVSPTRCSARASPAGLVPSLH